MCAFYFTSSVPSLYMPYNEWKSAMRLVNEQFPVKGQHQRERFIRTPGKEWDRQGIDLTVLTIKQ